MTAKVLSVSPLSLRVLPASGFSRHRICSVRLVVLAVAAVMVFATMTPVRAAETNITAISDLLTFVQNTLVQAAQDFRASGQTAAQTDIQQALTTLDEVIADLADPAVQQAINAKDYNKLIKLLQKTRQVLVKAGVTVDVTDPFGKPKAVIKGIQTAVKGIYSGNQLLRQPLLAEVDPKSPTRFSKSAGFHAPGELVQFQIDMAGCDETPTITVQNATVFNQSVSLSSVSFDNLTGRISMLMGPDEGGANVQVTACGKTKPMLLFNNGSKLAQSLPYGFPQDLQLGTYAITVSGTICTIYYTDTDCSTQMSAMPTMNLGTIQLANIKTFAKLLSQAATSVADGFNEPNAKLDSEFSPALGGSFSWTVSITGSAGGCTCSSTATLTIQQQ